MSGALAGKVAIVTGGGRGLGRAIAAAYAAAGAVTVITGRDGARVTTAALELGRQAGPEARVVGHACDATDYEATEALIGKVLDDFQTVDVLVNNAGINPWYRSAEKVTLEEWGSVISTNLTGVFINCQLAGRAMLQQARGGSIINISSVAGKVGLPRTAAYCAAKGGVEMLTRSLAIDWAKRGVRVNSVAPGYFETDLTEGLRENEGLSEAVLNRTPMRRYGLAEEIAGACLFLASDQSSYVTGQTLAVDGGFTAA